MSNKSQLELLATGLFRKARVEATSTRLGLVSEELSLDLLEFKVSILDNGVFAISGDVHAIKLEECPDNWTILRVAMDVGIDLHWNCINDNQEESPR